MEINNTDEIRGRDAIALLDMDGTVANYEAAMIQSMNALKAPDEPPFETYEWDKEPGWILNRMWLVKSRPEWWENIPPLQLGFDIVKALQELNYRIMVLTQGPKSNPAAWHAKVVWCQKHLPGVDITITRDKGLVYGKVLVDDFPPYIERWLRWRPRGLVIMPANRMNAQYRHPNLIRYDGTNLEEVKMRLALKAVTKV